MKASETFERYDGKVRECCNYAVRSSKSFMENADTNKRQPGGKAELLLREQLTSDLKEFCDEVDEVSFYAKQKAYITSNALTFFFLLATAVFAILFTLVNPYFILAALVTALLSLLAALGVFGGTSKSVEDVNVFARRKATGTPASRIIFEANLDAPFKRNISRGTAALLKFLTLLGVLLYIAFCVVMLLVDNGTLNFGFQDELEYAAYVLPIFVIFPLILSRTVSIGSSFPGVADNLLGAYAACGAMRYMAEQDLRLENTELCVLLTSSKEAKNAGAKAFVRDFKADLDALDTTILCFDSIYDPDSLNAVTKGRKVSKLVDDLFGFYLKYALDRGWDRTAIFDLIPVIYLLKPEIFAGKTGKIDVILDGEDTQGQTILNEEEGNDLVLLDTDRQECMRIFFEAIAALDARYQ